MDRLERRGKVGALEIQARGKIGGRLFRSVAALEQEDPTSGTNQLSGNGESRGSSPNDAHVNVEDRVRREAASVR
jgi:hypothetical protein